MYGVILALHILVSIVLVLIVLFQQPQKGGMGTVFGGGESIFGGGGAAPFLTKVTTGVAVLFVVTSLALVLMSINRPASAARSRAATQAPLPATPGVPTGEAPGVPSGPVEPAPEGLPQGEQGGQ